MKYLVRIAYIGTEFCGFQIQPELRTVQGELNRICRDVFGRECLVTGCSRTDRGVHARDFCITIEVPGNGEHLPPADRLPIAVIPYLPNDIAFLSAQIVPDSFHVRHDVKSKEYRYSVHCSQIPDPFLHDRAWEFPIKLPANMLERMKAACPFFLGTHDFSAFMAQGSPVPDTVRTIFDMWVTLENGLMTVSVTGDGFLYNMVRIITGTLIDVGLGKKEPEDIKAIIESGKRKNAGRTAPPEGLCLWKVTY